MPLMPLMSSEIMLRSGSLKVSTAFQEAALQHEASKSGVGCGILSERTVTVAWG